VPYGPPARQRSYANWGAWAAIPLALALRSIARAFPYELIHAHNAVPAGDAARRASAAGLCRRAPLVVSVHGGDVFYTAERVPAGARAVERNLRDARLVLANSEGIADLCASHGARESRVVHRRADLPASSRGSCREGPPTLVTLAHLIAPKRHADVPRGRAALGERYPTIHDALIAEGPDLPELD